MFLTTLIIIIPSEAEYIIATTSKLKRESNFPIQSLRLKNILVSLDLDYQPILIGTYKPTFDELKVPPSIKEAKEILARQDLATSPIATPALASTITTIRANTYIKSITNNNTKLTNQCQKLVNLLVFLGIATEDNIE